MHALQFSSNRGSAVAKYTAGLLLFGLNGIVADKIHLLSAAIVFWRTLFGTMFLFALLATKKRPLSLKKHRQDLLFAALSGVVMGLSWIFLYEAYRRIGVGLSSITYYCGPVLVMLCAPFVFREQLSPRQILCFATVFAGILLVSLPGLTDYSRISAVGLACGFASAVLHALMVIFTMKAPHITGLKNALLQLAVSFLTVALYMLPTQGLTFPVGGGQWFWMLFLGIVNTGMGCYLYFSDLARLPVDTVSILGYLEPLSAVVFAVILLGERLSLGELFGGLLILGGAVLAIRRAREPQLP